MTILGQLVALYLIFQMGTWFGNWSQLPIPGSVIGMGILLILLMTGIIKLEWISKGASLLLKYMPLFFLPVIAGVMQFYDLFTGNGIWLILIAVVSTWLVLMISALVSQKLMKDKESYLS